MARKLFLQCGLIATLVIFSVLNQSSIGAQTAIPTAPATGTANVGTPSPTSSAPLLLTPVATEPLVNGQIAELHLWVPAHEADSNIIQAFENLYHVKVVVETYANRGLDEPPDQGIDVIVTYTHTTVRMRDSYQLAHLDFSQIPNFKRNVSNTKYGYIMEGCHLI